MNVLLVDYTVENYEVFISFVNSNTIPIVYFEDTSIKDMLATLNKPIEHIGIISNKTFSDFFKNITETYPVKQIHYLELNTSQTPAWVVYFKELDLGTEDIELIYFNQSIKNYSYSKAIDLPETTYSNPIDLPETTYSNPIVLPEPSYSNPIHLPYKYYNDFPNCSNQTTFSLHFFNQSNLPHRNRIVPNQLNANGSSNSFNRNRLNRNKFSLNFSYRNKFM